MTDNPETTNDRAYREALEKAVARGPMSRAEVRAQKLSWIRGQTGATIEQIRQTCPELFDE